MCLVVLGVGRWAVGGRCGCAPAWDGAPIQPRGSLTVPQAVFSPCLDVLPAAQP
eukprot:COSAG02_NODE_65894_length_257_cov_0.506329_1_plen_53_part_10